MPCTHEQRRQFRQQAIEKHRREFGELNCRLCGACMKANSLQAHHVLPKNSGGVNDAEVNSTLVRGECHVALHDRFTGKLTHVGRMLLEGFIKNSKQRSYGIRVCKKG